MKKFFASLLALVGMVAGLALTSCGGGGGGQTNLDNTNIYVTGSTIAYQISFGSKLEGTGFYNATIGSLNGEVQVSALISGNVDTNKTDTETGLPSELTCTISTTDWDDNSAVVFASILTGGYKGTANGISVTDLTFTLTKEGGNYVLIWNWDGVAQYTTPSNIGDVPHDIESNYEGNGIKHKGVAVTRG